MSTNNSSQINAIRQRNKKHYVLIVSHVSIFFIYTDFDRNMWILCTTHAQFVVFSAARRHVLLHSRDCTKIIRRVRKGRVKFFCFVFFAKEIIA